MFVSDTIHNAQHINLFFFPMTMDLISLNTALPLDHNGFDHSFWCSNSSRCILYYWPQFSPNIHYLRGYVTKTFGWNWWLYPSSSWHIYYFIILSCRIKTFNIKKSAQAAKRGRFSSVLEGARFIVTAVQLHLTGKPLQGCLALLSVHSNNQQSTPCRLTCELP